MRGSLSRNNITEGVIWKQLLVFFFPILLGSFFQQLYNTVDAVVVGRYVGKEALAAVGGSTGTIINLLLGIFLGISGGATVIISQHFGAGIIRAMGDSKRPLYFLIAGCFLNIITDILFVVVFRMGVAGAALATILSQAFCAALSVIYLMRGPVGLKMRDIGFDKPVFTSIVRLGVPMAMQSALYSVSNIIIQSGINRFGTDAAAAWTAYGKVDGFFWMMIGAFGISVTTFAGQNFGAMKYERVKKSVKTCLLMAFGCTVFVTAVVMLVGHPLLSLFTDDAAVLSIGVSMIRVLSPFYVTYICIEVLSGAMRGCGDTLVPTIFTVFGVCVLRAVWVLILMPMRPSIAMVELSYPVTWSITSLMFIIYYLFGGWMGRCIKRAGHSAEEQQ